jgi:PAS domain S-box-containing protein
MKKDGTVFYASLESITAKDDQENPTHYRVVISDITGRKKAEEETERFASFPKLNPNPVLEVDSFGKIIFFNKATTATLKKLDLGEDVSVFLPDDMNEILKALGQESETQFYREINIKDKTFGEALNLSPQFNSIRIYANDITERKRAGKALLKAKENLEMRVQERTSELSRLNKELGAELAERKRAEEQLQKSEHKYRILIEQAADGIVLLDRELNLVDVNSTACKMTGFTREELLKLNARDLYQPGELEERPLRLNEVLAGETVITERRATKKDGSPIEVEIGAKLIEGSQIQAIVRDITERKNEERRSHLITELLELFARKTSRKEYLDSLVELIHNWTGCRHVGIRVVNKENYIPYASYIGFSKDFMRLENMISLDSDACACIRVIAGKFEPQDASADSPRA